MYVITDVFERALKIKERTHLVGRLGYSLNDRKMV